MAGVMPAVWRGNYVMELDKDEGTSILNSYRFSQSTCASRNLPQWRYESSCLDFRICHRHADSCVFLPSSSPHSSSIYPFFRFPVSNSAKLHAVLPLPGSSFPAPFLFVLFLSSYAVFWIFILLPFSVFRFSSVSTYRQYGRVIACVFIAGVIAYIKAELEGNKFSSVSCLRMNEREEANLSKNNFGHCHVRRESCDYSIALSWKPRICLEVVFGENTGEFVSLKYVLQGALINNNVVSREFLPS